MHRVEEVSLANASGEWGGECGPRTRRETTIRFHVRRRRRARRTQVHARCRTLLLALQPPTLLTPRRICMSYVSTHLFSVYSPREARASASSVRESSMLRMGGIINYSFAGSDFELGRGTLYLFSFRRGESKRPATSVLANSVLHGFTALYIAGGLMIRLQGTWNQLTELGRCPAATAAIYIWKRRRRLYTHPVLLSAQWTPQPRPPAFKDGQLGLVEPGRAVRVADTRLRCTRRARTRAE
eukprot:scaffold1147_cov68-Phaeocystis_antarctica.AAC.10